MAVISWINALKTAEFLTGTVDGETYQVPTSGDAADLISPRLAPKATWEYENTTDWAGIAVESEFTGVNPVNAPVVVALLGLTRTIGIAGEQTPWIKVRLRNTGFIWRTRYITFSPSWGFDVGSGRPESYQHNAFLVIDNDDWGIGGINRVEISLPIYPGFGGGIHPVRFGSVWLGQALEFSDGIDQGWRVDGVDGGIKRRSEGGQTFAQRRTIADNLTFSASVQEEGDVFMNNNATSWRACQRYTGTTSPVVILPNHVAGGPTTEGGTPVPGVDKMHEFGIYGYFQNPLSIVSRSGPYYKVSGSILEER